MVGDPRAQRLFCCEWVKAVNDNQWIFPVDRSSWESDSYFFFRILAAIKAGIVFQQRPFELVGIGDDIASELVKNGIRPEIVAIRIEERLRETKLDGSLPW